MTHKTEKLASTDKYTTKATALSWDIIVEPTWGGGGGGSGRSASKAYHIFIPTSL